MWKFGDSVSINVQDVRKINLELAFALSMRGHFSLFFIIKLKNTQFCCDREL